MIGVPRTERWVEMWCEVDEVIDGIQVCNGHFVLCQGSCYLAMSRSKPTKGLTRFIRADHTDTAKRFYARQLFDDSLSLRHPQHAESQSDGGYDGQALGNSSNSERHCCQLALAPASSDVQLTSDGEHFQPISLLPYSKKEDHSNDSERED